MITAPYNFVPLNREIFYPTWSNEVSHDIPFEDGESGEIEVTITAKSPIFIRNHYQEGDEYYLDNEGNKISKEFCSFINVNGGREYYIPGSSVKGMVRSVVEIMSYSEIKIDETTHKKTISVRDMRNNDLKMVANACGFLVKKNGKYIIQDCGKIKTISYAEIQKFTNKYLRNIEDVVDKYKQVKNLIIPFKDEKKFMKVKTYNGVKNIPKIIAVYNKSSKNKGQLVFTNFINNKKNEFVFKENGDDIEISNELFRNFTKVYFEDTNSNIGQYWKKKWNNNEKIPIFYKKDKNDNIIAIGLTQIFKIPYKKTIFSASKQNKLNNKIDLAQTIFGYANDKKSLKGRVYFSHFKSNNVRYEPENKKEVLGTPNPTYYPNYIEQTKLTDNGKNVKKYITLMDADATIRGFKRYPLQPEILMNTSDKDNVISEFKPLQPGCIFNGKIRFHNLKKEEIGALLSALTFHGNEDKYFHNLGLAKPLGYGKISLNLKINNLKCDKNEYLKCFEKLMNYWDKKDYVNWIDSVRLKELYKMADKNNNKKLEYQKIEVIKNNRKINEFDEAKKNREFLMKYSELRDAK